VPSWDFAIPQAMQQHGGHNRQVAAPPVEPEVAAKPMPGLRIVEVGEDVAPPLALTERSAEPVRP